MPGMARASVLSVQRLTPVYLSRRPSQRQSGVGGLLRQNQHHSRTPKQLHQHRYSLSLSDLKVSVFRTPHHQHGVRLQERHTARTLATFACRSYNDQQRFVADVQESIAEVEEMERARIFINDVQSSC